MAGTSKNKSLQAKTAARMAAVQLVYKAHIRSEHVVAEALIKEYASFMTGEAALKGEAPNKALLSKLLEGVATHGEVLEKVAYEQLKDNWKPERVSPILRAILQLAIFELDAHRSSKTAVILDEYTTIANRLLDADEVGFVHASLHTLAEKLRA